MSAFLQAKNQTTKSLVFSKGIVSPGIGNAPLVTFASGGIGNAPVAGTDTVGCWPINCMNVATIKSTSSCCVMLPTVGSPSCAFALFALAMKIEPATKPTNRMTIAKVVQKARIGAFDPISLRADISVSLLEVESHRTFPTFVHGVENYLLKDNNPFIPSSEE
ncbi:MAG: hypothetical protein UU14_C0032G0015 [Candidatus Roizmanbacteria bacterium GW2011_GWB1_40_7]|uniref:Uncharacterized protein n=1 Tax=Candidatus Roizmanbacteria bacterium GW2011_GWB1_40_7 TaxID=1618482 RepID=A0A0G0W7R7_9BACT|nr:MAG: hypothetical protein UU14_C0032G0015 [Candidatus Roizmanbacteria bacterium GW2011_GWB1_40_7]